MSQGEGGGRPKVVFDDDQIRQVENLAAVLNQAQLADFFGIDDRTFRNVCKRQDEVYSAYKRGRAKAIAGVGSNLLQQARNGNVAAACFYLKTQAGWREQPEDRPKGHIFNFRRANADDNP